MANLKNIKTKAKFHVNRFRGTEKKKKTLQDNYITKHNYESNHTSITSPL